MTIPLMSTSNHSDHTLQRKRIKSFDRVVVARYAQLVREKRRRIQSSQFQFYFTPRMDVLDKPDSPNIVATLELPGLRKEEISLLIQDGSLVIWGERRARIEHGLTGPSHYPVQEVKYGKFRRVIPLPAGAQSNEISASIMDGMLTITWPRFPASYSQHRPVETGGGG